MTRRDEHLDAMLRHLGAAYYDSLRGRAAPGDVSRAVDQVAGQMGEKPGATHTDGQPLRRPPVHHGHWHSRVRDVMTTDVITVDRITPFKDIARLLVDHQVSGVPVLILGRHVAGVVTESDLIAARDRDASTRRRWTGMLRHSTDWGRHQRLTAEKLMTSPAVTIHPDASLASAARLMSTHRVMRLPVVDQDGKLLGIVSRRDLLTAFLVPDDDITRQVRELLAETLPETAAGIDVAVHGGIVTLKGEPSAAPVRRSLQTAIDFIWDIDGVVDVIDHISISQPA